MRQKAQQAGNLKTTPKEKVTTQGQTIVIQPAAPDVVYVPQYDPWLVYGYPLAVFPGWYPLPGLYLGGPGIAFGLGSKTTARASTMSADYKGGWDAVVEK
jgi:Protein of unknown function (DUF3300)